MNSLPVLTTVAEDVNKYVAAISTQKAEAHFFQFLNGLDESYASLRSQLLMQHPLPSVESAYAMIQQEESQKDILVVAYCDVTAMYSRSHTEYKGPACTSCGQKNHSTDRCWTVIGYPRWHRKYKPSPKPHAPTHPKPNPRFSNSVTVTPSSPTTNTDVVFTHQQLQQLLKLNLLPTSYQPNPTTYEDELDQCFSGMVTCYLSVKNNNAWIIDSGASDHMTFTLERMMNVQPVSSDLIIKLSTGATTKITHTGDITLHNGLVLRKVFYVPQFKNNFLSIHKLSQDNACVVNFHPTGCTIIDAQTNHVKAVGTLQSGLYYMKEDICFSTVNMDNAVTAESNYTLWYNRLGHAPMSKLKFIPYLNSLQQPTDKVCVTCPMSKFTKLPFDLSKSHVAESFALIHVDTWGPYKMATRGKYKFFLIILE